MRREHDNRKANRKTLETTLENHFYYIECISANYNVHDILIINHVKNH